MTRLLRSRAQVRQTADGPLGSPPPDVVLILENVHWFPILRKDILNRNERDRRPLVAVWHWEPLPLPEASGFSRPSLSFREIVKIVLRDPRATDVYTNLDALRRWHAQGLPDLLLVSSRAWQESLAEHGISSHWIPYGYEPGDGAPIPGTARDIEALFVGALEVPRRKRLFKQLRRRGVALETAGSWFDGTWWGPERTRLINRAQAVVNIQRYSGEVSAHRLILGMANRALVVSEPIYRPEPFVPGRHYVEAEVAKMPDVLRYYREHPEEREEIVDRAHRFVTRELVMESAVARFLDLIADVRARVPA